MPREKKPTRGMLAQDFAADMLRRDGWLAEVAVPQVRVQWINGEPVRKPSHDFFGCIDIIAVKRDRVRFIQVTTKNGTSVRVRKIQDRIPDALLEAPLLSWEIWEHDFEYAFTVRLVKPRVMA